jgi:hypothetical protein
MLGLLPLAACPCVSTSDSILIDSIAVCTDRVCRGFVRTATDTVAFPVRTACFYNGLPVKFRFSPVQQSW